MEHPKDIEIISDVVIRFLSHNQYGSEVKAIKALSKRLGNIDQKDAEAIFKKHVNIFNKTKVIVVKKLFNNQHFKENLFKKIQREISEKCNCGFVEAGLYINWCYFFYVLK